MFVLDNTVVRQGWKAAKAIVTDILDKHEAKTITARRWDERRLAYPIKNRGRGTYMISYFELEKGGCTALSRSLELNEAVLRYLITRVDTVPVTEAELASCEDSADFVVPAPPVEDAPVVEVVEVIEEILVEDVELEAVPEGVSVGEILPEDDTSEPVAATVADEPTSESTKTDGEA